MVDSGVQPTIVTFNELIKCCSRARSLSMATYYLKEMEKYGLQPDKITAHFVIVTCAKVGDFDSADTQLRNMQEHGIAPTQEMYAYLASGACTHNRPLRACAYLEECLARGLDVTPKTVERLQGAGDHESAAVLEMIYEEEKGHVRAGTFWFAHQAATKGAEPAALFHDMVRTYFRGALKPPFNTDARHQAGLDAAFYEPLAGE